MTAGEWHDEDPEIAEIASGICDLLATHETP